MEKTAFQEVKISGGKTAVIHEGYGKHYFHALSISKGDHGALIKSLLVQLVEIDGKETDEKDLDRLPMKDISYLGEVVSLMMQHSFNI